jgi:hypothetical protein
LEAKNQILERRIQAIIAKDLAQAMSSKAEIEESLRRTNTGLAYLRESAIAKEEEYKQQIEASGKETSPIQVEVEKAIDISECHVGG